jgi:hypothetical protein
MVRFNVKSALVLIALGLALGFVQYALVLHQGRENLHWAVIPWILLQLALCFGEALVVFRDREVVALAMFLLICSMWLGLVVAQSGALDTAAMARTTLLWFEWLISHFSH